MRTTIKTLIALVTTLGLFACGEQQTDSAAAGGNEEPGPAATFCVERGGEYLSASGECRIGDGMVVDAEAFYRAHADEESVE